MDKIQKTLVKLGHRDLAQEYFEKVAGFDKYAAYPKIFLSLDTQSKKQISRQYGVGPKSEVEEIQISKATRKPYSENLLVYTTFTLSEKQQKDAQKDLEKAKRDLENDSKYQDVRGSRAGDKMYEEEMAKARATIDKKYKPMEHPVAWGIGTYFIVNNNMFRYYYGGRGRPVSTAPSNRKQLIEYIKDNKGKVYHITKDSSAVEKMKERVERKDWETESQKAFKARAKAFGDAKSKEMELLVDKYVMEQGKIIRNNLNNLSSIVKNDWIWSEKELGGKILKGVNSKKVVAISKVFKSLKNPHVNDRGDLLRFVKEVNTAIKAIK